MLKRNLRNCEARNFWHNKVWVNDPDCVIFRSGTGINKDLVERHKNYAENNKTSKWAGDNIAKLRPRERRELLNFFNSNVF